MNEPFVDDLWCIFQPTQPGKFVILSILRSCTIFPKVSFNAAVLVIFRVPKWLFHIMSVGRWTSLHLGKENSFLANIHIILAWLSGVEHAQFPCGWWVGTRVTGLKMLKSLHSAGFCSPRRGKIFVNRNFPRLKWVDYFFEMNCWDSPGGWQMVCVSFAPGAGWKWLEDSIYVRLLIQFSVINFPGFNNADFCGPKRLQFNWHDFAQECEFRRLNWVHMMFYVFFL